MLRQRKTRSRINAQRPRSSRPQVENLENREMPNTLLGQFGYLTPPDSYRGHEELPSVIGNASAGDVRSDWSASTDPTHAVGTSTNESGYGVIRTPNASGPGQILSGNSSSGDELTQGLTVSPFDTQGSPNGAAPSFPSIVQSSLLPPSGGNTPASPTQTFDVASGRGSGAQTPRVQQNVGSGAVLPNATQSRTTPETAAGQPNTAASNPNPTTNVTNVNVNGKVSNQGAVGNAGNGNNGPGVVAHSSAPTAGNGGGGKEQGQNGANQINNTNTNTNNTTTTTNNNSVVRDNSEEAELLRQYLRVGNNYNPDNPNAEQELERQVQDILRSRNANPTNNQGALQDEFPVAFGGAPDPGSDGTLAVTVEEYNFGNTIFDPVSIAGTAGVELTAQVIAPTTLTGQRPVLVFLHGNHSATYNPTTFAAGFSWPPVSPFLSLPNYRGYEYVGRMLASHGYIVVSISGNGVNVLGGINMVPRAELMHRHLNILRDLNNTGTVTGAGIVDDPGTPQDETRPFGDRFVGKLDLTNIGTMGHSRGGDGVVAHYQYETGVNLGSGLPVLPVAERYPIKAVLPLAPVDFTARTINGVPLLVLLPYNDGDVSDLQGQGFYDRARYNVAGDDAAKHVVLVRGASHNPYNTIWFSEVGSPFFFQAGRFDDGAGAPRITAPEQRSTALAYFGAFYRTYVGNAAQPVQQQFFTFLTGDSPPPASVLPGARDQIFWQYHPVDAVNARRDVNRLDIDARRTTNTLGGAVTQGSLTTYDTLLPYGGGLGSGTPRSNQLRVLRVGWNNPAAFWQNDIPTGGSRDVSRYYALQFRAALDFTLPGNPAGQPQNFQIVLTDGAGASASATVAQAYTGRPNPIYFPPQNRHEAMNSVRIPLSLFSGVDLSNIASIRFNFNQVSTGGLRIADLMFTNRSLGFDVSSTTPAVGSIVSTAATTFAVTFSDAYTPASVQAGDLRVNGIPADSVALTTAATATFTYATSPVTTQGLQTMLIAAGDVTRLADGEPVGAFTGNFRFDLLRLAVVATTPATGSGVQLPFTQLDVDFNEPVDPASVGTSDLTLSAGTVTAATALDADTVRYTLSGITAEGTLTATIAAGALTDVFGNPNVAFVGTYFLDIGTVAFPNLTQDSPPGSLIYDPLASGLIGPAGDTDSFTTNLGGGQTITVVVRPTSAALRPTVELRDPSSAVVGAGTAPAANQAAYIQVLPTGAGGLFTITVGGADSTVGNYTVQVILNAAVEDESFGGPSNDTPATAQDLANSYIALTGNAQRGAVLGRTNSLSDAHPVWAGIPNPFTFGLDGGLGVSSIGLQPAGSGQVLGRWANNDAALIVANSGRTYFNGFMPYLANDVPSRQRIAQNEISLALTGVSGPRVLYFLDVGPGGTDPYVQALTALGITPTVVGEASTGSPEPAYTNFISQLTAGGWDLVIFQQRFWFVDAVVAPFASYVNGGGRAIYSTWNRTQIFPGVAPLFAAFGATSTGVANQTVLNQAATFTPLPDYYSFSLTAGQSVTLALDTSGSLNLELRDASDTVLAMGRAGSSSLSRVINNFVARADGTYYARVSGAPDANYTLLATRNADFDTEANNAFIAQQAQHLVPGPDGNAVALGHVIGGGGGASATSRVLYFVDVGPGGVDPYRQALTNLGITPTVVAEASTGSPEPAYTNFISQLTAGGWDLVIFQQRFWFVDAVVTPLVNYVNGGGRFVYSTWNRSQIFPAMAPVFAALGATTTGGANQTVLNQTVAHPIWEGIPNPFNFTTNGGLGVSSIGLQSAGSGQAIGRWANGDAGLIVGNDGRTVFNGFMPYLATDVAARTRIAQNEIGTVLGGISDRDIYQIGATEGQKVRVQTSTPLENAGNRLDPAIRVYDSQGNVLAFDDNSGADGKNASVTFVVPETGLYFIEVLASPDTATPTRGEYVLTIGGATGEAAVFEVLSTTPIQRARLRVAPATMTVNVNHNIYLPSLQASDLTVDGVPATGLAPIVDGARVTFTLPTGLGEGVHLVNIARGALQDASGAPIAEYNAEFYLDTIRPTVIATSIAQGDTVPAGSLSITVTFSEPLNSASVVPANFTLQGLAPATPHTPASFTYDVVTSVLTINYNNLGENSYRLTLFGGTVAAPRIADLFGNPLAGNPPIGTADNFVLNFAADVDVTAFPALSSVAPLGSLIYQGQTANPSVISSATDTDGFTLPLAAGDILTVLVRPVGTTLRPTVTVTDPDGKVVGTATAAAAGQVAALQTVTAAIAGTYTMTVSGDGGTTGSYNVQVYRDAAVEAESIGGPSNNTRATAQDVNPTFLALPKGASRGGLVGRTDAGATYTASAVTPTFESIATTGTALTFGDPDDASTSFTPAGFSFPFFGTTQTTFFVSTNGLITFGGGDASFTNTDLTNAPALATIAPYWDDFVILDPSSSIRWQVLGTGASQRLVVQWTNVQYFVSTGPLVGSSPTVTFQAVLGVDGSIQFNFGNLTSDLAGHDNGLSATVGIKAAGPQGPNRLLVHFNQPPSAFVSSNLSTRINPPGVPTADFYSLSIGAGQTITAAATALGSGTLTLELQAADGTVLATGATGAANVTRIFNNVVVASAGTYYLQVGGASNVDYSLVVTLKADFDTENNNTFATAQNITGTVGVLGHVSGGTNVLYAASGANGVGGSLFVLNQATGAVISTVGALRDSLGRSYGLTGLAAHPTSGVLYGSTANGSPTLRGNLVTVNPATALVTPVGSFGIPSTMADITFSSSGVLYGWEAAGTHRLLSINPATGVATGIGAGLGGLFGGGGLAARADGTLFSTPDGATGPRTLRTVSPVTGAATIVSALSGLPSGFIVINAMDFDSDGSLYGIASDQGGPAQSRLVTISTTTAAVTTLGAAPNDVDALAFQSTLDEDWYFIDATAGQALSLPTATPAPSTLDPHIELFAPDGSSLAVGTPLADGRNETIEFTVTAAGRYRIRVTAEGGTRGEYFLDPVDLAASREMRSAMPEFIGNDGASLAAFPTAVVTLASGAGQSERADSGASTMALDDFVLAAVPRAESSGDDLFQTVTRQGDAATLTALPPGVGFSDQTSDGRRKEIVDAIFAHNAQQTLQDSVFDLLAESALLPPT